MPECENKLSRPLPSGMHADVLQSSMLTYRIAYVYGNKEKIEN